LYCASFSRSPSTTSGAAFATNFSFASIFSARWISAEIDRLRKEVERAEKMLANERFVENAAPDVVEAEREKLAKYRRELDALSN